MIEINLNNPHRRSKPRKQYPYLWTDEEGATISKHQTFNEARSAHPIASGTFYLLRRVARNTFHQISEITNE